MRKLGILLAVIAVIGVGAYFALSKVSNNTLQTRLEESLKKLPPDWKVTYKSADYTLAANEAVLKGVEIHGTGATKLDATIDEIDVTGPALDLDKGWAEAAANPAGLTPDKPLPVVDGVAVKGVAVQVAGANTKIGSARFTKLRLYPWALVKIDPAAITQAIALMQTPPAQANPDAMLPVLRLEAAALLGFGYDSYTVDDVNASIAVPGPDGKPQVVAYTVKHMEAANIDRGKMASASMDGIAVTALPDIDVKVDHVGLSGFDIQQPFSQLMTAAALDPAILDGLTVGKIEYVGLTVKTPSGPPVTLGSIAISNIAVSKGLPVSGEFAVGGFKVTKAQITDEQAQDVFNQLGLDAVTVSFGAGYKWDVDKKTAALKDVRFKIDELGDLNLSADFSGIEKADDIAQKAVLNHAVLRFNDASFTGRAFKAGAVASGADPAQFRTQMLGMVQAQSAMLGKSPGIAAASKSVVAFLTDPHNLTIELAPPAPLPLASLDADKDLPPEQIFTKLGVKVTSNQ